MEDSATTGKKRASSSPAVPSQKQKKKQQQQDDSPPPNMLDQALEHVVRVGNQRKHEALRIQAWREKHSEIAAAAASDEDEDTCNRNQQQQSKSKQNNHSAKAKHECNAQLHAQDIRLYATKEWCENGPWPSKKKRKLRQQEQQQLHGATDSNHLRSDKDWDHEVGDGIHPVAFPVTRLAKSLSSSSSSSDLLKECAIMDLDPDGTASACNVKPEHACKVVLQRCWERAVHAVASTLPMTDKLPPKPYDFMHSMSAAKVRCKSLKIDLTPTTIIEELKCPCCDAAFTDAKLLDSHYYGTKDTRGCSWNVIEKEEQRIIEQILAKEVEGQLDTLLRLIVSTATLNKQEMMSNNNRNAAAPIMNWNDILGMLQSSLDSSREVVHHQDAIETGQQCHHHPLLETLDVDHLGVPLLINSTMMSSLRRRLEERYNDSPR